MTVPPEILVLRALGLGDLLTAVPALRALRRAWHRHRLVLATPSWLAPLARPEVDEVLAHPGLGTALPARPAVDVAVNLHGRGPQSAALLDALGPARRIGHATRRWDGAPWRDGVGERQRWCDLLGWFDIAADPTDLLLPPPDWDTATMGGLRPGLTVVHPGAGSGAKRWPPDRFAAVAAALTAEGHRVVVTGSAAERDLAILVANRAGLPGGSVLAGRTPLTTLAALVAHAALVVCADTGVAHLAAAYRTPSVVLYGPVPAWRWGAPAGWPQLALSADRHRRGDPFAADPDPALLDVTVPEVLAAARQFRPDQEAEIPATRTPGRRAP